MAGGTIGSSYLAYKSAKDAREQAQQLSPTQQQMYGGATNAANALTGSANTLSGQSQQLFNQATPAVSNAMRYYQTLMGQGGRSAMEMAVAPMAKQVSQTYQGAQLGLDRSGLRGGQREQAMADIGRERAGALAGLTQGVQPGAATALGGLGTQLLGASGGLGGQALQGLSGAGSIYSGLAGQATQQQGQANALGAEAGQNTGAGLGALMANLANLYQGNRQNQQWQQLFSGLSGGRGVGGSQTGQPLSGSLAGQMPAYGPSAWNSYSQPWLNGSTRMPNAWQMPGYGMGPY